MSHFSEKLVQSVLQKGAPACVGIDPHLDRLPADLISGLDGLRGAEWREAAADAVRIFSVGAVEAVAPHVPAIKPQVAFFEALGAPGVAALEAVVDVAQSHGLIVVLDAKRGDIGSTARAYAFGTLDDDGPIGADSVTLNPYLGAESMAPFLEHCPAKGVWVLLRTSNPGAEHWQLGSDNPISSQVGAWVTEQNRQNLDSNGLGPVGVVVGATIERSEVVRLRNAMPHTWFLVPGYGAQGAGIDDIGAHFRDDGLGALVVSARGIVFGSGVADGSRWREMIGARAADMVTKLSKK